MFERRLKILLGLLAGFCLMLLLRAGWLQVVQGAEWQRKAAETAKRSSYLETFRGRILDYRGRVIAEDAPCIDAAVDYRAIDTEGKESQEWLRAQAKARLVARGVLKGDHDNRTKLIDDEVEQVKKDLQFMWSKMAQVSGKTPEEIEEVKQSIVHRVQMRQRYLWYRRYEQAKSRYEEQQRRDNAPSWLHWLTDDTQSAPQLDSFKMPVAEQTESHPILRAIDNDAYIVLDKLRDRCPGLELRKGTRRNYPYHDIGCHVVGNLAPVMKEDQADDPHADKDDGRRYLLNDMIGRSGIEGMAEQALRGSRGFVIKVAGRETPLESVAPIPGQDVRVTLDMELQMRIQEAFLRYEELDDRNNPGHDLRVQQMRFHVMHGAAVVIDVPTGEVRALVSYPTYDVNNFEALYPSLLKDAINLPLLDRATQAALEPGSTVKPMVGLSAITAGVAKPDDTVECTGYLIIDGKVRKQGRCWVASKFGRLLGGNVAHHPVPWKAPHPTGFLTFADALERSCNVFFETMADRLKLEGLHYWMGQFGLGHRTGIGIPEVPGRIPSTEKIANWRGATWFSGIGQSQVLATPIQMANVAATIARRGIWIRPHLLESESAQAERRDLHLNQTAVDMAWQGMINVVSGPAGTGQIKHPEGLLVAGKTGTAQAARFNYVVYDDKGKPERDEKGNIKRIFPPPSTPEAPNKDLPWYRGSGNSGDELGHAWFIGFAPADHPKIAFAVLVEYGGAGGKDAGPVATAILEGCIEHGYLQTTAPATPTTSSQE
ncbi:MAG TPA: penicillin-binding transpeptidase domain-containing protein [Tepidisphaeraceae bacterium]|jgi:penicillin-binding protein 2